MQTSAGVLLYRRGGDASWEVLIVHPSGNYNRRAPWSIPKGVPDEGESEEEAARRECLEETGVEPQWLTRLGEVTYRSRRKRIVAFAGPAPHDAQPRCASWEIDQAAFVPLEQARKLLHPDQATLLDKLTDMLDSGELPQSAPE